MNPPKLLTLTTPVVRNQRTLVWLQQQSSHYSWDKWDGIVTSMEDYTLWYDRNARIVGMILTKVVGDVDDFLTQLYTISRDVTVIFLSQNILQLKPEEYWAENYDNLIVLNTMEQTYPFLDAPWDGSDADAVALCAHLLRYQRVVDCVSNRTSMIQFEQGVLPERIWLITQYFRSPDMDRREEIKETLRRNCACAEIELIILMTESDLSKDWKKLPGAEKITQVVINKRLTYAHFLQFVHDEVPANIYVILANADIYFDSTLLELWKLDLKDKVLALLRWDDQADGSERVLFGPRADSQDAWIMLSNSIKEHTWPYETFDFQLGQAGCDNAFAAHLLRSRFSVFNPCLSIKTGHIHMSNIRTYTTKNTIRSDLYLNLAPTHILSTKQETVPSSPPQCICNQLVSFEVKSSSMSNEITYCTMLEKEGRYKWEATVENHYFEPAIPVYSWENAGVTQNGLVFTPYSIFVGKHADQLPYWEGSTLDILTPLQSCDTMLAIPFHTSSVFEDRDSYLLQYFSRAIRLSKEFNDLTIWCPPEYMDIVQSLSLESPISLLPWSTSTACWAKRVIGMLPSPSSRELGHEDIQAIRGAYPAWKRSPSELRCVIITDSILTSEFVDTQLSPFLKGLDDWLVISATTDTIYEHLVGASLCILISDQPSKWSSLWALPTDTCVIEFQQELELQGESQHLYHVSDIKSWVLLLSKGKPVDIQRQIMVQLEKWFKKNGGEILCIT